MSMALFKPRKIIDPFTGKERIVSPEEQEMMLMKGIIFSVPSDDTADSLTPDKPSPSSQKDE